ncbi:lysylphosphatidylglycerol synthase domain-containing protein [Allorhizobium undicola]|uniref:lysylphosphatidylglycerol synthase domain-containing protein n=1 Tax=Allorhizobium undicola TaxID=78527 RepID=UPI000485BED2|nr:lysylphosphatidylglycerol synthase domain-containing protein [Allorhizobium undicola]
MKKKILLHGLMLVATVAALWLTYKALSQFSLEDIKTSLSAIPASGFALSLCFCALSYLCLTGFDYLGLLYAGHRLEWRKAAIASFSSLAIGHNIGLAALSSGAVRYRYYARWGLKTEEIAKVILFCGSTVAIGLIALAGICLVLLPESAAKLGGMGKDLAWWLGLACLGLIGAYIVCCFVFRGTVRLFKWRFTLPEGTIGIMQVLVGIANFASVAACLHWLARASAGYFETTTAYVVANLSALVAHVPGGLGVMEATISFLMGKDASIGALIAFRVVYFFIPLPLGALLLAVSEYRAWKARRTEDEADVRDVRMVSH